jgi:hypothetical protein
MSERMRRLGMALIMLLAGVAMDAAQAQQIDLRMLDEFEDVSAWKTVVSDGVLASVHTAKGVEGNAMVLEFDLQKTAGYAAAGRAMPVDLPDDYEISFWMRGEAGRNHLEIKFLDASGDNVWWYRRANFSFSGEWQQIRIKRRQIQFAWGPTDDKTLRHIASIEFVIAAGMDGGKGDIWIDRLAWKPVERSQVTAAPTASASSTQGKHIAAFALDNRADTAWQSDPASPGPQTLQVDLQSVQEFGGIEIDWLKNKYASQYKIETSLDGQRWKTVRNIQAGNGGRDSHLLPESEARFIRVTMLVNARGFGISQLHIRDLQFGASPNAFIESLAQHARRGCYPRGFTGEQTYWTMVGVDGDREESLISEDGAIEAHKASFSVEPFIRTSSALLSWADVDITHSLADNYLPIPSVHWTHRDVELTTTAFGYGEKGAASTRATYLIHNPRRTAQKLTLALVVRPFQVNPPAQFLNTEGGVTSIQDLAWQNNIVSVDGKPAVIAATPPQRFRAVTFDADSPCEWLTTNVGNARTRDETGLASGALYYDIELAGGASREITLDLPLHPASKADAASQTQVAALWQEKLNRVELKLPPQAQYWFDTLRTALAHVLINRDGPGIQPGSRSYERSWIRDGAMTSEMLLRLGHEDVAREFLLWYADYQFENGKVPCCVDVRGADPVPENDSMGEFLFLIAETYRYTSDEPLLRKLWPRAVKAVHYMDKLRLSERTTQNTVGERRAFYGLMPASISHEGYSAKPMHSYWDNFWALAGYEAAIRIARALKEDETARQFIESRDQFRSDLYRSLETAMHAHNIDYLPGAAELGDFDATSTSIALSPVGEQQMLPPDALNGTFERYYREFVKRRTDKSWDAYTPYEWRNVGVFVRLGWRERTHELFDFFMDDRRPAQWNQWAEVVGREVRKSRFIGDMPHGWVASDYARSMLDLFAYERPADETLVLMAGVPVEWTKKDGFAVKNLRTAYGLLNYSLSVKGEQRIIEIADMKLPVGGVAVAWPQGEQPKQQTIEQGSGRWINGELRIQKLPFRIVFQ